MQQLPEALAGLRQWPQFTLYRTEPDPKKPGKNRKIPVAPFDRSHDATGVNPHKSYWWVDADTAMAQAQELGPSYGVAFVITERDPFFLLDIDNCQTPNGWSDLALGLLQQFAGAAVEVSNSRTGMHILGTCSPFSHGTRNEPLGLEFYTKARFVALTGLQAGGNIMTDCTASAQQMVAQYFGEGAEFDLTQWTTEPREDWLGYTDDTELLERAMQSASVAGAFGGKASFSQLWRADEAALSNCYPDGDKPYNESQADAGLAQHLAFWTGCDCERMRTLMEQSALTREKWEAHKTYLQRTILKACAQQGDVHKLKRIEHEPVAPAATLASDVQSPMPSAPSVAEYKPELVSGYQYLAVDQQLQHFAGCVYVQQNHAVLTPDGEMLKPDQFKATYGGYLFALDANNDKQTKNAWEAFVESQAIRHLKVHRTWFKPERAFGQIDEHDGLKYVNTYKPIGVPCVEGDVAPFLNHLRLVLPDERDQAILVNYMAAIVQFKGYKFQWAPLIQGAEGNGKSLFSRCVAKAIGDRYSYMPRADQIGEKFNEWLFGNIFIGVEDIYVPEHKRELMEILKPMVTESRLEERGMARDKVMKPVCCNFIFNSNHMDAVRKTKNDRRFAPLFCAQQSDDDIERDMGGTYFPELYAWLRNGGFAAVTHYLETYQIQAELNPAVECGGLAARAPRTTSTETAVTQSLGRIEQEILEAIDEKRAGFAGGWISSSALDKLLEEIRAADRIPRNKRRQIVEQLGYELHPGLERSSGRATSPTVTDGTKPRLFIKKGHLASQFTVGVEIVAAYDKAQSEANQAGDPAVAAAFSK